MFAASMLVAPCLLAGIKLVTNGAPPARPGLPLAMSVGASVVLIAVPLVLLWLLAMFVGAAHIPNDRVGILEKLWSLRGNLAGGRIIATRGEAGYQAGLLRGGLHFGLWRWQYRIHRVPLVTVPQGKIAYVYARDGEPLSPGQTLGRIVPGTNFQDAAAFLGASHGPAPAAASTGPEASDLKSQVLPGQRGRQR